MRHESEIGRYVKGEVEKLMRKSTETRAERAIRELRGLLKARRLRKAAGTAKPEITVSQLASEIVARSNDVAFTAATALCKAAQNEPMDLNPASARNPAASENSNPTVPGGARGYQDLGGNDNVSPSSNDRSIPASARGYLGADDDSKARAGDSMAISRLVQRAMKPVVLAAR